MDNRINPISVGAVADRQTPINDFGAVLARGLSTSASMVGGVASAVIPGGAVISAAISGTANMATSRLPSRTPVNMATSNLPSRTPEIGGGIAPGGDLQLRGGTNGSSSADGLQAQRELMEANQQWTTQYLALQGEMQRESREFTAISNILKVRHESSKTAINNIR